MRASIIMGTYKRDALLDVGLCSMARQRVRDCEIVVVNDGPDTPETRAICDKHGARYIVPDRDSGEWRNPANALNVAAQHAQGDVLVLTCPEIYHVDDCIEPLIACVEDDPYALAVPQGKDEHAAGVYDGHNYSQLHTLNTYMPFCMAVKADHFAAVGGYDPAFSGLSGDDMDTIKRLRLHGCHHRLLGHLRIIHLYHPKQAPQTNERLVASLKLLQKKTADYRKQYQCPANTLLDAY